MVMSPHLADVIKQARWEVDLEEFEAAVEAAKEKIRAAKWWHSLVPFTIEIKRRIR